MTLVKGPSDILTRSEMRRISVSILMSHALSDDDNDDDDVCVYV